MLAAVTPPKYAIKFIDERYRRINYNVEFDIVGISTMTPSAVRAYEIADKFRAKGVTVIIGGWHASALPKEAKQHADSVVIGDAENSWPQLLKDLENNKLQPFYEKTVDLEKVPLACRNRILHRGVNFIEEIQATRGCYMNCKYCSVPHTSYRRELRFRPIEDVVKEISSFSPKYVCFIDSSVTLNLKYTKQLFKAMKGLNKKFSCNGNVSILHRDNELLKLAKEAGCKIVNSYQYLQNIIQNKKYICHAPKCYTFVLPNGNIVSCCDVIDKVWGNVKNNNFNDLFKSKEYKEYCKKMEKCYECNVSAIVEISLTALSIII